MPEQLDLDLSDPVTPSAQSAVGGSSAEFSDRRCGTADGVAHEAASALDRLIAAAPAGADRPATLQLCLDLLAVRPVLPKFLLRDARSAISSIAKVLGRDPTSLPADPVELRPLLRSINWPAQGTSRKREANIRSALTTTLLVCGWIAPEFQPKARQTPAWEPLLKLAEQHKLSGPLGPFARFCAARNVQPEDVISEHLQAYEEARLVSSLDLAPRQCAIRVATAWNRAARKAPNWPQVKLGLPSAVVWKGVRLELLPQKFQHELAKYLAALRDPDPFDPDAGSPLREISVQSARRMILRAVAYLVSSGAAEIAGITSLAQLVEPQAYRALLLQKFHEAGNCWDQTAVMIAGNLLTLAKRSVRPGEDAIEALTELRRKVSAPRNGISRSVRERLAQFRDERVLRAVFDLPEQTCEEAERELRVGRLRQAAKLHELGIALGILQLQPVRRKNLAQIDLGTNLVRNARGRLDRIIIDPGSVKSPVTLELPLPPELAALLERHIKGFRPHIPGHDKGSALFPAPSGRPISPCQMGRRITKLILQQLGVHMTPHDARHLAATLLLDADPGNIVVAQRLLGHLSVKTTMATYGTARTSAAQNRFAEIVDGLRSKAARSDAAKQRRREKSGRP